MKKDIAFSLIFLLLLVFSPSGRGLGFVPPDVELPTAWEAIAPGIDFQKFHLNNPRPVNIFVTRMDRTILSDTIDASIAQGKLASGRESITGMAARYDQALNFWGASRGGWWGERNHVVVAINGYFFDGATGTPWSGLSQSGWYAKRFDDTIGDSGFTWTLNRTAHIGSCVYHIGNKNSITFPRINYSTNIKAVDVPPGNEDMILYTPLYDQDTNTSAPNTPVLEIQIEMTRPTLVLPPPAYAIGYIREINDGSGSTMIPFDHVVISAWGNLRSTLLGKVSQGEIAIGDQVNISQEISDCASSPQNNWTKTYATIGGDYHFLNNGVIRTDFNNPDASVRNSRTAIGFNNSFIYYIVVDAFDLNVSEGLTIGQLGDFTKNTLGAAWGVTMDSGTSSTMVINGQVVNNTKCNFTRDCGMQPTQGADKLQHPTILPLETTYGTEWTDESGAIEPLVGSGMMMIVSEPLFLSSTFSPSTTVTTLSASSIHLGPGNNYAYLATVPQGTSGMILPHINHLNGVLAKGAFWWKVNFGGVVGWIREQNLVGGKTPANYNYRVFLPLGVR